MLLAFQKAHAWRNLLQALRHGTQYYGVSPVVRAIVCQTAYFDPQQLVAMIANVSVNYIIYATLQYTTN